MDDKVTRGEALRQYIKGRGFSQREAADKIGMAPSHFANLLNAKEAIGFTAARKICAAFPEVSQEYLLLGKGQLLKGPDPVMAAAPAAHGDAALLKEVENLREQLERERSEKARLLGIIETITTK